MAKCARHPFIYLPPSRRLESHLLARLQKCPDLFQAQFLCVLHADVQSQACELRPPSGSCCVINTVALQAHPALYKTYTTPTTERLLYGLSSKPSGTAFLPTIVLQADSGGVSIRCGSASRCSASVGFW